MDIHATNLAQLCRVSGTLLSRSKKNSRGLHTVAEYNERLEMAFRQAVSLDNENIHPRVFCHTCYRAMTK